jgi:hypothetical protein
VNEARTSVTQFAGILSLKKIAHKLSHSDTEEARFNLFQFLQIPLQSSCVNYARNVNLVLSLPSLFTFLDSHR